jgi:cytochrome c-type biogenesis protein CcmH
MKTMRHNTKGCVDMTRSGMKLFLCVVLLSAWICVGITSNCYANTLTDIENEVMCVECGTPLNVSTSPVAERERAFIQRQVVAGKNKQEIKRALSDEFGPAVLALPQAKGFNWAAYLAPVLAVMMALITVTLLVGKGRRRCTADGVASLSVGECKRLEDELRGFERQL